MVCPKNSIIFFYLLIKHYCLRTFHSTMLLIRHSLPNTLPTFRRLPQRAQWRPLTDRPSNLFFYFLQFMDGALSVFCNIVSSLKPWLSIFKVSLFWTFCTIIFTTRIVWDVYSTIAG